VKAGAQRVGFVGGAQAYENAVEIPGLPNLERRKWAEIGDGS